MVGDGLRLSGTCAFSNPVYEIAVGHLAAGRVPAADLISERVSLEDTPAALVRLREPGDLVRILTRPGGSPGQQPTAVN
jgi:(R,R)-butanediol dehydrogenase / meso-butanediol dehydrogenase / diacetyl reductase